MIRRLSIVAITLLAAGCGGGSSVPTVSAPGSAPQSTGTANASVKIVIPGGGSAAQARRVQYVSAATQSLSFTLAGAAPIVVALTSATPGCVSSPNGLTCTVNVPLPIGANESFLVSTYQSATGTGAPLATTTLTTTIVAGQSNPLNLTLGGVPAAVTVAAPAGAVPTVAATSIPVTVTVTDASNNTIIGNTPFADANGNPVSITLSNSDASGATKLTPAALTAPGSATLAYDSYFQPTSATISAAASGLGTANTTITFAPKTIAYTYNENDTLQLTLVARNASRAGLKSRRSVDIPQVFPLTLAALLPTGNASTPYALGTHVTTQASGYAYMGFASFGMATAPSGHLYFTEKGGAQFGIFDAGTTPTLPAPGAVIAGTADQQLGPIALGPGGVTYAGITGGFQPVNPVTGALTGTPVTVPAQFRQTLPEAIAVGPDGTVYLEAFESGGAGDDVLVFTQTNGTFSFARSFWCGNFHHASGTQDAIYGIAVDAHSNVYVSEDWYGTISVVPGSSSGNVLPAMVYSNDSNQDDGANLVVDRAGNIVWTTYAQIYIYGPNTGTVPPPGTNPANSYYPNTDTPSLQLVTGMTGGDHGGAQFNTITFGPGL